MWNWELARHRQRRQEKVQRDHGVAEERPADEREGVQETPGTDRVGVAETRWT